MLNVVVDVFASIVNERIAVDERVRIGRDILFQRIVGNQFHRRHRAGRNRVELFVSQLDRNGKRGAGDLIVRRSGFSEQRTGHPIFSGQ